MFVTNMTVDFFFFFFCIAARLRIVHILPTETKEFYFTQKVRDAYFWKGKQIKQCFFVYGGTEGGVMV